MSALVLEQVTVSFARRPLFAPLTVTVEPGVVLSVLGPSGAGKSSLLGHLAGALPPALEAVGRVRLGEELLDGRPPEQRRIGILFQDDLLFPHLSVGGNLGFGSRPRRAGRAARREAIGRALESIGLGGFYARDPATLSGGQRARVALLRVLLSEPCALLMDEPFGRLDAITRAQTREWVFDEVRRRRLPTLLVTHDREDVTAAAGPSCVLKSCAQN
jgi:putative thiamine transport system ATP-binding protein